MKKHWNPDRWVESMHTSMAINAQVAGKVHIRTNLFNILLSGGRLIGS
jgi:hypothetical protein